MTKYAAIQAFFEGFGLPVFPEASVPTSGDEMPQFPYLTYSANTDSDVNSTTVTASLWYRTESWAGINAKTDEISGAVSQGVVLNCDDGGIIIRKGTPFAQPMGDNVDNMIKRKILMFDVLFATTH